MPGIATGVILALSRAIGETAPLIVVGAATFVAFDPDLMSQFTALPIQIFYWVTQPNAGVQGRWPPARSSCCWCCCWP